MEQRHRLELIGITYNQIESGVYALILQEAGSTRRLPIIIGFHEAQAIECKLQEIATPRPLTHDTMSAALSAFGISLVEVEIRLMDDGIFAADLVLTDGTSRRIVDSRSSDAIALAIRVGAPIYTSSEVMDKASFDARENSDKTKTASRASVNDKQATQDNLFRSQVRNKYSDINRYPTQRLMEMIDEACEKEDYKFAAQLKKELDRRNSQQSPER